MGLARLGWPNEDSLPPYTVLLCVGLVSGAVQALLLRRVLPPAGRWIAAWLVGSLLALLVLNGLNLLKLDLPSDAGFWENAILLLAMGAVIGATQGWALRHRYPSAGWWALASALGWLAFLWIVNYPTKIPLEFITRGLVFGALAALPTGLALMWLGCRPKTGPSLG